MKPIYIVLTLFCLIFAQVVSAMPMQNIGHASKSDVVHVINHKNNQHDIRKHDLHHAQTHDCCDTQTTCDNCPSSCQFRVMPLLKDIVFRSVLLEIDSSTITTSAKNPHAGYYSALFKPPILS